MAKEQKHTKGQFQKNATDIHIAQVIVGVAQCRFEVVTLKSILSNWKTKRKRSERQQLYLHIICDAKSKVIMNTVLQTWLLTNVHYTFHVFSNYEQKTAWMHSSHYSATSATLRLYLPEILDTAIQKVISIDTDVLFLDDISELWDLIYEADENQAISMAKDESYLYTIKIHTTRTRVLKGGYNGGVVLLHLDRLRQRGWPDLWQRALEALLNVSMFLPAAEQDIMSVLVWMNKDLFYPLPCVWNLQLNPVAYMSACLHSRSATCWGSVERPHAKLLHMNRRDKFELTDDEHLTSADTPETEKYVRDRFQWYLFERKKISLLNGYKFSDTTANLSHGTIEKIYQQVHTNAKLPRSLSFCTENEDIYEFCDRRAERLRVPRAHAYFFDQSHAKQLRKKAGITLAFHINFDSIPSLEDILMSWRGPVSIAICASDRQAFRLPLVLSRSTKLTQRTNISYHIVYPYDDECPVSFAHNAAVAFSLTTHVLILNGRNPENGPQLFRVAEFLSALGEQNAIAHGSSAAFILIRDDIFEEIYQNHTSLEVEQPIPPCSSKDKTCQFQQLRHASAVILPTELSLVPLDASADSFFEFLVWSLLNSSSDAYTVVKIPSN
uniref:Glycosyltransferase-like protein LARGE2 n=1 Tax=Schistocephalus solidus TaxID=70667 RepID=A0A0X3NV51_SCHSO